MRSLLRLQMSVSASSSIGSKRPGLQNLLSQLLRLVAAMTTPTTRVSTTLPMIENCIRKPRSRKTTFNTMSTTTNTASWPKVLR